MATISLPSGLHSSQDGSDLVADRWTEFLIAHVGALRDFTIEYSDHSLASTLWDQGPVSMGMKSLGMENYSLATYFHESDSLVHNTPKPLVRNFD